MGYLFIWSQVNYFCGTSAFDLGQLTGRPKGFWFNLNTRYSGQSGLQFVYPLREALSYRNIILSISVHTLKPQAVLEFLQPLLKCLKVLLLPVMKWSCSYGCLCSLLYFAAANYFCVDYTFLWLWIPRLDLKLRVIFSPCNCLFDYNFFLTNKWIVANCTYFSV